MTWQKINHTAAALPQETLLQASRNHP